MRAKLSNLFGKLLDLFVRHSNEVKKLQSVVSHQDKQIQEMQQKLETIQQHLDTMNEVFSLED